ncbi:MAG: hypothetical protein ABFD91_02820 [Anaerohalosphaeraceae bacterium]
MQWIKWIRKNRQTVMTVAVIVLMIAFVGGYGLEELLMRLGHGGNQTIGTYSDGLKITNLDMQNARQELEILKAIMADQLLFSKTTPMGSPDINSQMLGYLLFSDSQVTGRLRLQLRQVAQSGRIPLTTAQVDDFFAQDTERPEIMWTLLSSEAKQVGIVMSNEQAGEVLRQVISQMTENRVDAGTVLRSVASQIKVEPAQVITTFGKLLAIIKWSDMVCDNESVTLAQTQSLIGRAMERIDAEFAKFPADWFIDAAFKPTDEQIKTQFEAFKTAQPGQVSDQNPFGFGYMLPHRVQMEYFVILSEDVKKQTEKPTAEAMENYYSTNIDRYRSQTPVDPNKPDGDKITKTQTFAEVSASIYQALENERIEKLMQLIMKDAKDWLDEETIKLDMEKATLQQIQQASGDYSQVAAKITEKYKVPVSVGRTGLLSLSDFASDDCLRGLQAVHSGLPVQLSDAAFSVSTEDVPQKSKIGVYVPRMWENIGPMDGGYYSDKDAKYMNIKAVCRVIDVQKAATAESADTQYNTAGVVFDKAQADQKVFNLKQRVMDDLQKQNAMAAAGAKAEEFKQMIATGDWDKALDQYNAKYAPKDPNKITGNAFRRLAVTPLQRQLLASDSDIARMRQMMENNPANADYFQELITNNILNIKLFALLGDKAETGVISETFEFKPGMSWYVTKNIKRQPANKEDYIERKGFAALQANFADSAGLGLVHFNPQNIRTRMNYTQVVIEEPVDTQADQTSKKQG